MVDVKTGGMALLAVLACGALAPTAGAHARPAPRLTPSSPVTRGSGYLALGDSVTFGYQEPGVVPAPEYRDAASFRGYPEQLGTELHLRVTNLACPGETSASLINPSAESFGCENAYRKAYPLHTAYRGSQLTYAVSYLRRHHNVRLVSLMIGANDLFLCESQTHDGCLRPSEQDPVLARVAANVRRILSAVRKRAGYSGQVVVVNYYSLNYASALISQHSLLLDRTQDNAARPFHVRFADGYGEWQEASRRFRKQPCLAGLLTQTGAYGTCGVHPSYAGQALLAKAVAAAVTL